MMFTDAIHTVPNGFADIRCESEAMGFSMPSDLQTGALLQTLVASKPGARVLELGTGTGLATAWLLSGMDETASLLSIDTEPTYLAVAEQVLGHDPRLTLHCDDAGAWLERTQDQRFDLIFADAWPGKYANLDAALGALAPSGMYIIDDMLPQPNWPDGHGNNVARLMADLESRPDLHLVRLAWSTGILIAVKNASAA
jgi:predicted O-methyltransferase YrrM